MTGIPDLLYHTTLTVLGSDTGSPVPASAVYVLGTHTTLEAAKAFTAGALQGLGYEPSDFSEYAVHDGKSAWTHGDGVVVYAKAPAGQEFFVGIDTAPNDQEFSAGPQGTILLSAYAENGKGDNEALHLHYVLQTKTDYDETRAAAAQTTEIEGCYLHRADALAAAKACLKTGNTANTFAQYDERDDLDEAGAADWPFGEDVLVHAVSQTGENFTVAVRTIPGAHAKHAKKNRE